MATIANTTQILSPRAPAAAVSMEATHVTQWSAQTGGVLERSFPLIDLPNALRLGEQLAFAAGALQFLKVGQTGGLVAGVRVTAAGTGYTAAPTVAFTGGGGSGAAATAMIDAAGTVTRINVTNPGCGYTSVPTVTLTGSGSGATALALLNGIESDRVAGQQLEGEFSTTKWYQFHTGDPGNDGTENVIPIGRTEQPGTNWTTTTS